MKVQRWLKNKKNFLLLKTITLTYKLMGTYFIARRNVPNYPIKTWLVYFNLYAGPNDNIYIDMQAGRNLLPKLPVADN